MGLVATEILDRFKQQKAFIDEFGGGPNLTVADIAAYVANGVAVETGINERGASEALIASQTTLNAMGWGTIWTLDRVIFTVAKSKGLPAEIAAAFDAIDSTLGYSVPHARKRTRQTKAAMSVVDDAFMADGKTKAELIAALDAQIARDDELAALIMADKGVAVSLKQAVAKLDQDNKRIYKILLVSFPKGSREWTILRNILKREKTPAFRPQPPTPK